MTKASLCEKCMVYASVSEKKMGLPGDEGGLISTVG